MNSRKILYGASIVFFLIAIYSMSVLIKTENDYKKSNKLYKSTVSKYVKFNKNKYIDAMDKSNNKEENWYNFFDIDIVNLKALNDEIIGYIIFENEDIRYPLMHASDNKKYLRTTFDGKDAIAGSIFLDSSNQADLNDSYNVIYGHNMKNLSMFGKLKKYVDYDYFIKHKYFQIFIGNMKYRYEIFSYRRVSATSFLYDVFYCNSKGLKELVNKINSDSVRLSDLEINKESNIISLSTCGNSNDRLIINAVRVDEYNIDEQERGTYD